MAWPLSTPPDAPAPLGLGTAPLGGLFSEVDEDEAVRTVHAAVEAGVALVDTAPLYGAGSSEQRVGLAWSSVPVDRRPLLSTKVGRVLLPGRQDDAGFVGTPDAHASFDWSDAGIRSALEGSLGRLGVDRVDVALAHDPDDHEDAVVATGFPALRRLREEGLVTAIGAGMNQAEMLDRFVRDQDLDVILLAGRWTLLDHRPSARALLDRCAAAGVAVMLGGVLNSGLLAGGSTFNYAPAPPEVLARRDAIAARCREHAVDLEHAAMRFCAGHPAVRVVLIGARSVAEVTAAAARIEAPVPDELWEVLRRDGLLDPSVPDPMPVPS